METIYKYCDINEYTIENLTKNQLYFNEVGSFNDPYELAFNLDVSDEFFRDFINIMYGDDSEKVLNRNLNKSQILDHTKGSLIQNALKIKRITCFGSRNSSLLMWGHYARKHSGICIEYYMKDSIFKYLDKVEYTNKFPKITVNSIDDLEKVKTGAIFEKVIRTKYEEWEYEQEYRLLDIYNKVKYVLVPGSIKSIYFGLKCDKENIMRVIQATYDNKVEYYQAQIDFYDYKLVFLKFHTNSHKIKT